MMKTPMPLDDHDSHRRSVLRQGAAALLGGVGASLAGCGGGGDDTAAGTAADDRERAQRGVDSGGTGGPKTRYYGAVIDATAPLTVNGLQFTTDGTRITNAEGQPLELRYLMPGMTGLIDAERPRYIGMTAQARALAIQVGEQLFGPVRSVDPSSGSFMALEQRVVVNSQTVFGAALAARLAALSEGLPVQVWGQLDPSGARIVATRVDLKPDVAPFVARGVLTALDRARGQAAIGSLQLAFSAEDASVIAPGVVAGDVVRATLSNSPHGPQWTLQSMRGDALRLPDHVEAEIDGRVTRFDSIQRFAVDGIEVDASAARAVQGASLLALGARVEVHGRSGKGVLRADSVTVEPDEPVELEGMIGAADAVRRIFVVKGIPVAWSEATRFEGGTARMLTVRRHVAVLGRWNVGRTRLEALHIHVEA